MKVTLIKSSVDGGDDDQNQYLTSYLIDDTVAVDAGPLGFYRGARDQARIKHVLISHTHIDHIASLPIFIENAYEGRPDCVTVHGSDVVLDCLRRDLFNNRVWPDFVGMSDPKAPFLRLATLQAGVPLDLEGLRITPVAVDHLVPTLGFIVEGGGSSIVITSDTGPTEEIWQRAERLDGLKAVFLEAAFPDSMTWLAEASKHLTPAMFGREVQKLSRRVPFYAVHIKQRWRDQIIAELNDLGIDRLEIAVFGKTYHF